ADPPLSHQLFAFFSCSISFCQHYVLLPAPRCNVSRAIIHRRCIQMTNKGCQRGDSRPFLWYNGLNPTSFSTSDHGAWCILYGDNDVDRGTGQASVDWNKLKKKQRNDRWYILHSSI